MLLFKTTSVLSISVFWSFMVACPAAGLLYPRLKGASTRNDHEKSTRLSISVDHVKFLQTSFSQVDKRGQGVEFALASFEQEGFLVPVQAAADVLEAFYTEIAINSHGPWANNTPRIWITITLGAIRLLMTATEGTTIPWDFVTEFALQMLRHTERGYTGTYTANFISPTMGNAVWVSLYHCAIGPLTDPAVAGAPAKVASCLNAEAPAWFPMKGTPTR